MQPFAEEDAGVRGVGARDDRHAAWCSRRMFSMATCSPVAKRHSVVLSIAVRGRRAQSRNSLRKIGGRARASVPVPTQDRISGSELQLARSLAMRVGSEAEFVVGGRIKGLEANGYRAAELARARADLSRRRKAGSNAAQR